MSAPARRIHAVFPRMSVVNVRDAFAFRSDRGWHLAQRFCFWLLGKIGAYRQESVQTSTVTLDAKSLSLALLHKHRREVERMFHEPMRLILGAKDWSDIMHDPLLQSAFRFEAPIDLRNGKQTLLGLDVTIVPWMRGVVILPKTVA